MVASREMEDILSKINSARDALEEFVKYPLRWGVS